ncbi:MAG: hypothetical protein J7K84_04395 [Deltaproteobacteria bacterium]|nr:hypothetical protein [Deltaproteobacteria bacterium]
MVIWWWCKPVAAIGHPDGSPLRLIAAIYVRVKKLNSENYGNTRVN